MRAQLGEALDDRARVVGILVLGPLGMGGSWFPARWPEAGSDAASAMAPGAGPSSSRMPYRA